MRLFSAFALATTTVLTIAVMWVRAKWATGIPEIATCFLAALWTAALALGRKDVRRSWVLAPLAGIVVLATLQVVLGITVYAWLTMMAGLYWAGNLAVVFVGFQLFADRDWRVRYLDGLMLFGVFVAVFSTIQILTSPPSLIYWKFVDERFSGSVFGPFLYVNQYAAFVELILPVAIYGALTRQRFRVVYALAAAVMAGSVFYVGSKGGSALVVLEFVTVLLLTATRTGTSRRQIVNSSAVVGVGLLWVAVIAGPDSLLSKVKSDNWMAGRREFNRGSLLMIKGRPVTGFGLGNWATAYPGYTSFDNGLRANQAHNDWLQWTVEGGIPMLLLMLSIAAWAIPRAIRSVWGIGVAVIFIHCLWDYPIQRTGVAMVFFTMMAAIAPYGRPERVVGEVDFARD